MSKNTTKTTELAENSPFNVTTERKGRGRRQVSSAFVQTINSGDVPDLTPEQRRRMREFYLASHAQELQFKQLAREWGCYC